MIGKNIKKGLVFAVIILFLEFTVFINFNISKIEPVKATDLSIKLNRFENSIIEIENVKIQVKPIAKQVKKFFNAPLAVPVFPGFHPAVASDTIGNVVIGFENDTNVGFTSSLDDGNTWSNQYVSWAIPANLPDVDSCGDGRFLCGFLPNYFDSTLYMVEISDPGLIPNGYECLSWDFDANFRSLAIAGYTDEEYPWMYGSCAVVCDKWNYTGAPIYFYKGFNYEIPCMFRVDLPTYITGCEVAANDIDLVTLYAYGVWNIYNSENGYKDIIGFIWDFEAWEQYGEEFTIHPMIRGYSINSDGNDDYIDVSAFNNNVIIVSQLDDAIVAYYSMDNMVTVDEAIITIDAKNPRIVHNGNNTSTCTFIKHNSLYYSRTKDGGATWSLPKQIDDPQNNNVPEEYKAADVCGFGGAWMNSGDGFVYYADIESSPDAPTINGPTKGLPFIPYTFTFNSTDPENDFISYYIDWGDGTNTGWTPHIPSGREITRNHIWTKQETHIIKAKAKDWDDLESPWSEFSFSTPKIRAIDKLILRFFENHPLLYKML